jgi:hypothetical protein
MARCLLFGLRDSAGELTVVDGGTYSPTNAVCATVGLDPSEYQSWVTTSALVTGFDIPSALTVLAPIAVLWAFAWVWSFVRR